MQMHILQYISGCAMSYITGSISFGYLIGRLKGVDIRQIGSHNVGATNVYRSIGKGPGIVTFILDFGKGVAAVALIPLVSAAVFKLPGQTAPDLLPLRLACGVSVILGHAFSVFLHFKGGKGVATGAGLVVGLAPMVALIAFAAWIPVFLLSRYVSLASIVAALVASASSWLMFTRHDEPLLMPIIISILAALIIVRHFSNIKRLLNGTENRFSFRRDKKEEKGL